MASWHLKGISISILGNVCQNLANNILAQRGQQHNRNRRRRSRALRRERGAHFRVLSVRARLAARALGSVQFVSNVVFLKVMHRAPITPRVVAATAAILVGCTFVILSSSDENPETTLTSLERWFSARHVPRVLARARGAVAAPAVGVPAHRRALGLSQRVLMPVCYVTISAIVGTWSTVLAKAVAASCLLIRDFRPRAHVARGFRYARRPGVRSVPPNDGAARLSRPNLSSLCCKSRSPSSRR